MGNKDGLAPAIVAALGDTDASHPLVDVFGGMCSVAGAMATTDRPAWANDIQHFAVLAARCMLTSRKGPPDRCEMEKRLAPWYRTNLAALRERFGDGVEAERRALRSGDSAMYGAGGDAWPQVGSDAEFAAEAGRLRMDPTAFPYRLATITFSWGYFGVAQAMQLDSLRFAIDRARGEKQISGPEADWCRLALLGAASRISSSPGHFAQYLRGDSTASLDRIQLQRKRGAWDWCLAGLDRLEPYGNVEWRRQNRVFRQDTDGDKLWTLLDAAVGGKAIVYADPPYSKEHYSRYYHVLESLERYDYPQASGVGRYRPDRFRTPFSVKTEVEGALRDLCGRVADRGWTLALSYPNSGLLTAGLGLNLGDVLHEKFSDVRLAFETGTEHSTLGGRHGDSRKQVSEYLWIAS